MTTSGIIPFDSEKPIVIVSRQEIGNGKVGFFWLNPLGSYLPDDFKIEPLDNTPQGIETIGNIRKYLKENK